MSERKSSATGKRVVHIQQDDKAKSSSSENNKTTLFKNYLNLLAAHPLLVNGFQSAVISVISIHFTKYFSTKPKQYSQLTESICMFIVSFTVITPCIYNFNKRVISRMNSHILVKVALDQFVFSPVLTFIIITSRQILLQIIQHQSVSIINTLTKSIQILPNILVHGWLFWLPVKFLSLHYIPFQFQILFSSAVAFIWNIILSMVLQ